MRILGWLAAILGVVGVVICLAIAIGVWFLKPEVVTRVDRVATIAVDGLDKASALATDAADLVGRVGERLDSVATSAQSVADSPLLNSQAVQGLVAGVTDLVAGPLSDLHDQLTAMRERVVGISDTVQSLDEAIPSVEFPGVATGFVDEVDAKWSDLDRPIQVIESVATNGITAPEQAARIAQAASDASARLDAVVASLGQVQGRIDTAQSEIRQAADKIGDYLTWGALLVTVVAVWVGLLHVLLITQGRRWISGTDSATMTTPTPAFREV